MFRLIFITVLVATALSLPADNFKTVKKGKYYKINGIVGGPQPTVQPEYTENEHIRNAPQDPFETADLVPNDIYEPIIIKDSRLTTTTTTKKPIYINYDDDHQRRSAHYSFDSSIQDDINDQSHVRSETRDGLKVTGMYSYSDGFFHRTVHYVADENGYRVVKTDVEKIGEGPQFNEGGRADVQSSLIGGYSIQIDDRERNPHYVGIGQKS